MIRDARRHAVIPRLSRFSRYHLFVGERPRGARHPLPPRCWRTVTWCPSIAARSSTAGTATRRSRSGWAVKPVDEALSQRPRRRWRPGSPRWCRETGSPTSPTPSSRHTGRREAPRPRFGIVAGYGGHGIGRRMHMDPFLPNEGQPGRGPYFAARLGARHRADADPRHHRDQGAGRRMDRRHRRRSPAAHWEHTVAVTEDGPRILTREIWQDFFADL